MSEVLGLITPLFGLIALGFICGKAAPEPQGGMGWLNVFILYLALPALFFGLLAKTPVERLASGGFILANLAATALIFLIGLALARALGARGLGQATVQALAGAYGNVGYMGPALAVLAFGSAAAVPVALIVCFENIMHFTVVPALMAVGGQGRGDAAALAGRIARSVLLHPFILASLAGIAAALIGYAPPAPVERLIEYLARAAAPCALFALGVALALRPIHRPPAALGFIVPLKLLIHPLIMALSLSLAGVEDPVWFATAVLLAALPTATNVYVIAQQYECWVQEASAGVLATTLGSAFTVSALLFAAKAGWLGAMMPWP